MIMKFNEKIELALIEYKNVNDLKPKELTFGIGLIYEHFKQFDKSITKQLTVKQIQPIVNSKLDSIYHDRINSLNKVDRQTIPRLNKTSFNDFDNKNITRNIKRHNNKHIHITYINDDEIIYGIPIEQSNCSTCKIRNSTNS